jgi:hypothetical protein
VFLDRLGHNSRPPVVRCSVCLPLSITTRATGWQSLSETALLKHFLPSLLKFQNSECEYGVYVGYDTGDPVLESIVNLPAELNKNLPVNVFVKTFKYGNTRNRNCHAINYVTEECFNDGFEYFLRVNDDSVFVSRWTHALIRILQENDDFGVVGLIDRNMKRIFTHSMISRKHFQIFQFHFPWEFFNWWSDDWITAVYGEQHTLHSQVEVVHEKMNRRYSVDSSIEKKQELVLQTTQLQWRHWLRTQNVKAGRYVEQKRSVHECASDQGRGRRKDALIACIRRKHNCSIKPEEEEQEGDQCATFGALGFKKLWATDENTLATMK